MKFVFAAVVCFVFLQIAFSSPLDENGNLKSLELRGQCAAINNSCGSAPGDSECCSGGYCSREKGICQQCAALGKPCGAAPGDAECCNDGLCSVSDQKCGKCIGIGGACVSMPFSGLGSPPSTEDFCCTNSDCDIPTGKCKAIGG